MKLSKTTVTPRQTNCQSRTPPQEEKNERNRGHTPTKGTTPVPSPFGFHVQFLRVAFEREDRSQCSQMKMFKKTTDTSYIPFPETDKTGRKDKIRDFDGHKTDGFRVDPRIVRVRTTHPLPHTPGSDLSPGHPTLDEDGTQTRLCAIV
ncbi:hypothetical protein JTE90_024535 [Oedothorax gibbosus]|uniref:Uncharacterized protein n=1 Tax=Oedothorax gibbosus TaxID=931172 RepID=A0AAV6VDZ2_9ARAC|nr:hypothetical protein JTE90_024535 [Oedothorax gibbosus]